MKTTCVLLQQKEIIVNNLLPHPEVREHIPPLHILSSQTYLSVGVFLIVLKISQRYLKNSMFEPFRSNL